MELILIEGLPGSGKSTLAESLCDYARSNGIQSTWYMEESHEHPVHPIKFKSENHKVSFPEYCLKQWQDFISNNKDNDELFILEGSLFQSTVRFMMEANNETLIANYFKDCQTILSSVKVTLIYLKPPEVEAHIDWLINHRGNDWATKVSGYLQKAPYCLSRNLRGLTGMKTFWANYALLCDSLVISSTIDHCRLNAGVGFFENQTEEAIRFYGKEDSFFSNQAH